MRKYNEIIRNFREDNDLTQKDIAQIVNTTQQQYSKYENSTAEIPVKAIIDLADFYQVSTDCLLGRVNYEASVNRLEEFLNSNIEIAKMLSNMKDLSEESKKSIYDYVKFQSLKEKNKLD